MILKAGLLTGMGDEYSDLVSTMESEWVTGNTDLANSILRLTKFADIRKENAKSLGPAQTLALLTAKPTSKPGGNRAPLGTCIFPDCIKKGLTTHIPDRCFLKFPELRNEHRAKCSLQQMKPKGSKSNLRKDQATDPNAQDKTPIRES